MATRGFSKLRKNHYFAFFFPLKLISKCCNFSMNWDRVKGFSAPVTNYPKIDQRPFLAWHMSKIFLVMRGETAPLQTPQTEGGTSPFWQPPDVPFWWDVAPKKWLPFLNNISETKKCLRACYGRVTIRT
jgi:hypothetical protein